MGLQKSKPTHPKLLKIEELNEIYNENGSFYSMFPLRKYVVKGKDVNSTLSKLRKVCRMNNIPLPKQIDGNYCCGTISIVKTSSNEIKKRANPVWYRIENEEVILTVYV